MRNEVRRLRATPSRDPTGRARRKAEQALRDEEVKESKSQRGRKVELGGRGSCRATAGVEKEDVKDICGVRLQFCQRRPRPQYILN